MAQEEEHRQQREREEVEALAAGLTVDELAAKRTADAKATFLATWPSARPVLECERDERRQSVPCLW